MHAFPDEPISGSYFLYFLCIIVIILLFYFRNKDKE